MTAVVLTAAGDGLGRRVRSLIEADPDVDRLIALDSLADVDLTELKAAFDGASVLVHLAGDPDATRSALDAAGGAGIGHVVLLSSATVYGAWANNPVPLTEDAPLRPNPGFDFAVHAGERERLGADWQADHPKATLAVLRPTTGVAEGDTGYLARVLRSAARIRTGDDDPPAQFVHLDDLAAAVDVARRRRLDGPFNVAPDGWIEGEDLRALSGGPRLRLPERLARLRLSSAPGGPAPFTVHPWVVANDRLKAVGWVASRSNEEAYVAGHRAAPWSTISPQRRQELTLAGAGAVITGLGVGVGLALRRHLRRR
ncbi:MAG: NAD-dependent epimerase/dehydratase family protein [Acidimicrobiales bacterium]